MKKLVGAVLGVALVLSASAQAVPTIVNYGVHGSNINSNVVYQGQLSSTLNGHSNNNAELYLERGSYQLLTNLGSIPAGTWVQSYILSLDPTGTSAREAWADISFDNQVLGLIYDTTSANPNLKGTDNTLGLGTSFYDTGDRKLDAADSVSFLGNTVTVDLRATTGIDDIRIVTAVPVPAPGAMLLAGLGTALVGWIRNRRTLA